MSFKEAEQYEHRPWPAFWFWKSLLWLREIPGYLSAGALPPAAGVGDRMPGPKRFRSWNRDRRSAQKSGAIRGQVRWYRPFRRADSSGWAAFQILRREYPLSDRLCRRDFFSWYSLWCRHCLSVLFLFWSHPSGSQVIPHSKAWRKAGYYLYGLASLRG